MFPGTNYQWLLPNLTLTRLTYPISRDWWGIIKSIPVELKQGVHWRNTAQCNNLEIHSFEPVEYYNRGISTMWKIC